MDVVQLPNPVFKPELELNQSRVGAGAFSLVLDGVGFEQAHHGFAYVLTCTGPQVPDELGPPPGPPQEDVSAMTLGTINHGAILVCGTGNVFECFFFRLQHLQQPLERSGDVRLECAVVQQ